MRAPVLVLILTSLLAAPAVAQQVGPPPSLSIPPALGPDAFGWVRVGMTHAQLESMAAPSALKAGGNDDPAVCEVYQFGSGGAVILEERGRVGRISLYGPGLTTVEGITVGDQATKVLEVYGDAVQRESAAYADPPAHDLYVWRSSDAGLRFEIDQAGIVSAIHGGNQTIRYIEGCQ